ncbi:MAG: PqqD family peptide modification chaperone [Acidimicrobiales bacterium]
MAPRPHHRVVASPLGDELALFHLDTRRLHVLNGSAAAIWQELHVVETIGDLAVRLGDRFQVSPVEIRSDVERTVEQLRADGLLEMDDRMASGAPRSTRRPGSIDPSRVDVPATGSFAALDARVGVVCDDEEIAAAIGDALDPLRVDAPPEVVIEIRPADGVGWTVRVGTADPIALGSPLAVALRAIGEVNNLAVASVPGDLVLHAGAVADQGRAVLLPGGSNHGKSTLTTALVADGFSYLTDEAAAVVDGLRVRAYPKSIVLDPGSFPLFPELAPPEDLEGLARAVAGREWHIDPARVGPVSGPSPVAAVICPQWRAGAATRVSRMQPVEALHLLLGDAFDFSVGGQPVFDRLVELVESVPVVKLSYGDTAAAVSAVREILLTTD